MNLASTFIATACLFLGGCASIVSGHNQSVSVTARNVDSEVTGVRCSLTNDKGQWYATTPGSVMVRRSYAALAVDCKNDTLAGTAQVKSSTKAMAFGNILFGGVIGVGVDVATGAAYDYPALIRVDLIGSTATPVRAVPPLEVATAAAAPVPTVAPMPVVAPVQAVLPVQAPVGAAAPARPVAVATATGLKGGQDFHNVRKLAQTMQCNDAASPVLMGKGPGSEMYSLTCTDGSVVAVQCDFGTCRALK